MGEILAVQAWDLSLDPGAHLKSCAWQCALVAWCLGGQEREDAMAASSGFSEKGGEPLSKTLQVSLGLRVHTQATVLD